MTSLVLSVALLFFDLSTDPSAVNHRCREWTATEVNQWASGVCAEWEGGLGLGVAAVSEPEPGECVMFCLFAVDAAGNESACARWQT